MRAKLRKIIFEAFAAWALGWEKIGYNGAGAAKRWCMSIWQGADGEAVPERQGGEFNE